MTFRHVAPLSIVTETTPSSVPVQITPARLGDSPSETMAGHCEMPSCVAIVMSFPCRPIVVMVSRLAFVVRSGEITCHESPRSRETKTLFAATINTPASCVEIIIGASHCQRYASLESGRGVTMDAFGRMLFDSPVTTLRRIMLPFCDSV